MALEDPTIDEGRYDPRIDMNYDPGYDVQDYIRNMMMQRGRAEPMGAALPDFVYDRQRQMYNRPNMEDLALPQGPAAPIDYEELGPMLPDREGPGPGGMMNPQDFIRQQLAGDVVPMPGMRDIHGARMTEPGVYMGSRGAAAINQYGGRESPYLDLLNILSFPGGGSMAPRIRR